MVTKQAKGKKAPRAAKKPIVDRKTPLVDYGPRNQKPASMMQSPLYCIAYEDADGNVWWYKRNAVVPTLMKRRADVDWPNPGSKAFQARQKRAWEKLVDPGT